MRVALCCGGLGFSDALLLIYILLMPAAYCLGLETDADIVVMLHPDYQYDSRLIAAMAAMLASDT